jgi:hypothetical protein
MLEKLSNLKNKVNFDAKKILSSKETLFMHWHRILFTYLVSSVIFIIVALLLLSRLDGDVNGDLEATAVNSVNIFTSEKLENSIKLQTYKNLVRQQVVSLPSPQL